MTKLIAPVHPGEILKEEFMVPLGLSANGLARAVRVPPNRISAIVNGERGLTADTALRLSRAFGTTAEFWLNLQKLYELRRAHADVGVPSLGATLRERSTRPDEDAPPHVQPQIIPGSTKKTHETDHRASTKARQSGVHKRAKRATRKAR